MLFCWESCSNVTKTAAATVTGSRQYWRRARVRTLMNLPGAGNELAAGRHTGDLHSRAVTVLAGKLAGLGKQGRSGRSNATLLRYRDFNLLPAYTPARTSDTCRQCGLSAINETRSLHNCSSVSFATFSRPRASHDAEWADHFQVIDTRCSCGCVAGDRWTVKTETETNHHAFENVYSSQTGHLMTKRETLLRGTVVYIYPI